MRGWFERVLMILTVALAIVGIALGLRQLISSPLQRDFDAYYSAARMANAGFSVYAPTVDSLLGPGSPAPPHREYVYPPLLAGLLRPVAALPYRVAATGWLLGNIALLGILLLAVRRVSAVARHHYWWTLALLIALPATYITWIEGQVSLILAVLILLAVPSLAGVAAPAGRPGNDMRAGVALGLAGALKVYPVVLLPIFAWHRRWRVVAAAVITGVLATGIGAGLAGGVGDLRYWFTHILRGVAQRPWPANQSLAACLERLASTAPLSVWTGSAEVMVPLRALLPSREVAVALTLSVQVALLLVSACVLWRRRAHRSDHALRRDVGLAVLLMSVVVPVVWDHYYTQLLLPAALLADDASRDRVSRRALLAAGLLIVLQRFWRQWLLHVDASGLVLMCGLLGVLVLWAATMRLYIRRDADDGQSATAVT